MTGSFFCNEPERIRLPWNRSIFCQFPLKKRIIFMWFSTPFSRTGHSFDKMHNFSLFSPFEILFKTSVRTKLSTFSLLRFCGKSRLIHQVIHIIHIFYPQFHGLHRFFRKQMFCVFIIIAFFRCFFAEKSLFHTSEKSPLFSDYFTGRSTGYFAPETAALLFWPQKTPAVRLFWPAAGISFFNRRSDPSKS